MLTHLQIRDFAIVEAVELDFDAGMTTLTGETGAGKSIVVDALTLVAGARAGADVVRAGAERAEIAATFDLRKAPASLAGRLAELDIPVEEHELLVRRVVTPDGRSRAWLGGQAVPLQSLREIVGELVDIHGQHEFQALVRPAAQRALLDDYGRHEALLDAVRQAWKSWNLSASQLAELEARAGDREARLEYLRFQVGELDALAPQPGEYAALAAEGQRLAHRGRLLEGAQAAAQLLYEDDAAAHRAIVQAGQLLRGLRQFDPALDAPLALLEEAAVQVAEAARELSRYADGLEMDPARQAEVQQRLAACETLARKHRIEPDGLPERLDVLRAELAGLATLDEDTGMLRRQVATALAAFREAAATLSAARAAAALRLGEDITRRMQALGMKGGRFAVLVAAEAGATPRPEGTDQIGFEVTANAGQPLRPLGKVASGGELSRLSLAIQVACAADEQRCMVFDEVDSGIGGAVAGIVGGELRALGARAQVLCVTHLPQVAAQGDCHLQVSKQTQKGRTRTAIRRLEGEERVAEVARMLGGTPLTETARAHAREMLERPAPGRSR
ncbi:MAG: hypothetical protein RL026_2751 [Pseudomonadota bacterium]|jgi:DNA repair protein RecN (Recombination protein N)